MSKERPWPNWAYKTHRAFKSAKRQDVRALVRAVERLRNGCAYMPSGSKPIEEISRLAEALEAECSIKQWGR
jgi:hypothetical protein